MTAPPLFALTLVLAFATVVPAEELPPRARAVRKASHWAFQPVSRPPVPESQPAIDYFIRQRLMREGLSLAAEAERSTLINRLHLDLIGLPPTPAEVATFVADDSPAAYERLVDRLLGSPHYGERWGRHWLDAARYADSDGYEKDTGRPFAWRYREWVIHALNRDLPFDQFTIEQLAGDLLPGSTIEQKTATGFHRNTLTNKEGGVDAEEFRVAAVVDRVNTTGTVWLGLTIGCCQCHNHKYDPLSQREYYQLFAFFNSDRELDLIAPLPEEQAKIAAATRLARDQRQTLTAAIADAKARQLPKAELTRREKALAEFEKKQPVASRIQTIAAGKPRPTHVMIRGDFLRPGEVVHPATPSVLPKQRADVTNRLDLARWLVGRDNPLTPRVIVNWVWGKFFGRGLVATQEDFGTQGLPPSHPELLDWLATTFRDDLGWSLKKLHKQIVMSATYRQSSAMRPELSDRDPLNVLLARQSRLRLESEIVRDRALAVSGLLNPGIGGPSIRPPQPSGVSELTYANSVKWVESKAPEKYKRGIYIWFQRTSPYPSLMTFDNPDSNVCAVKRERSNTPLQALTILNDAVFVEAAQALAGRVQTLVREPDPTRRAEHAFALCFGRKWNEAEQSRILRLYQELKTLAAADTPAAAKLAGPHKPANATLAEAAAWVGLCRTLMNLDEFVTRE